MVDLVEHPDAADCAFQTYYDGPHHYCNLMRQKDINCLRYLEERKCPFFRNRNPEPAKEETE